MNITRFGSIAKQSSVSDPNLLINPDLNIDTNEDGVADDWSTAISSGITANFEIDTGKQRINITASTSANNAYIYQFVDCLPGDVFNAKATGWCNGDTKVMISLAFYNGAAYISQNYSTQYLNADNQEITLTGITAPANTTRVALRLFHQIPTIGLTGSAWFTDAELKKVA